ncbi:aminopeptidase P N-terminal domain-containing protein [Fibrobacterota bacterium]
MNKLLHKYSHLFPAGSLKTGWNKVLCSRRAKLLKILDSFAVFSAIPAEPGEENLWFTNSTRIFQEPSILYLTGINQPGIRLILDPNSSKKEVLFIPEKDPDKEFWTGTRFGFPGPGTESGTGASVPAKAEHRPGQKQASQPDLDDIHALTGIRQIKPLREFKPWLKNLILNSKRPYAYCFFHQYVNNKDGKVLVTRTDYNWKFARETKRFAQAVLKKNKSNGKVRASLRYEIRTLADTHFRQRLPLEHHQINDAKIAMRLTGQAFKDTLKKAGTFKNEHQLASYLEYSLKKRSVYGLSFPAIAASGKNALVLHYIKNDDVIKPGGLVLLDFGLRYGVMHSDISRTIPASGRFDPLQSMLYSIVLDALRENQRNARAGITIRELDQKVWHFIEKRLQKDFFSRGGVAKRPYGFQPHKVSHLMGLQVHDGDPHRQYQDIPMKTGWQISSEPGIYGHFKIQLNGRTYSQTLGIRIEDNLLIQARGCVNLSRAIPRTPEGIEKLMTGQS